MPALTLQASLATLPMQFMSAAAGAQLANAHQKLQKQQQHQHLVLSDCCCQSAVSLQAIHSSSRQPDGGWRHLSSGVAPELATCQNCAQAVRQTTCVHSGHTTGRRAAFLKLMLHPHEILPRAPPDLQTQQQSEAVCSPEFRRMLLLSIVCCSIVSHMSDGAGVWHSSHQLLSTCCLCSAQAAQHVCSSQQPPDAVRRCIWHIKPLLMMQNTVPEASELTSDACQAANLVHIRLRRRAHSCRGCWGAETGSAGAGTLMVPSQTPPAAVTQSLARCRSHMSRVTVPRCGDVRGRHHQASCLRACGAGSRFQSSHKMQRLTAEATASSSQWNSERLVRRDAFAAGRAPFGDGSAVGAAGARLWACTYPHCVLNRRRRPAAPAHQCKQADSLASRRPSGATAV